MCLYAGETIAVSYGVFKALIIAKSISNVSYSRDDDRNSKLMESERQAVNAGEFSYY
jgi:hypothetical protein